jgi:hypothetical protein
MSRKIVSLVKQHGTYTAKNTVNRNERPGLASLLFFPIYKKVNFFVETNKDTKQRISLSSFARATMEINNFLR